MHQLNTLILQTIPQLTLLLLLVNSSGCTHSPLIANSQINQSRMHDTVSRASYATGLQLKQPLSATAVTRDELHKMFLEHDVAQRSEQWIWREAGYRTMGFSPEAGSDSYQNANLLSRSVAGLYIPRKETLYVVSEPALSEGGTIYLSSLGHVGDELTLAHEVIHALQHQHFPEAFTEDSFWQQQADANTALQATIEGDATFRSAQSIGLLGRPRDPDEVIELARDSQFEPLSDAATLVRERIQFPYTYGYRFAFHEGKSGLKSLPASTEQIIHIGTKGRSPFLAVDLSEVVRMAERTGCRVIFQDTMGELLLSLWFRGLNPATEQTAWNGWDGDRWIVIQCGESKELAWLTSWDTEQDAVDFEIALRKVRIDWQQRANLPSKVEIDIKGKEVMVITDGLRPHLAEIVELAKRRRVSTRAELAAHFGVITHGNADK